MTSTRTRSWLAASLGVTAMLFAWSTTFRVHVAAVGPEAGLTDAAWTTFQLSQRESLGLSVDPTVIDGLVVGQSKEINGLLLTDAEHEVLQTRMDFQAVVLADVMPSIKTMEGFAGAYFDNDSTGGLVVHVLSSEFDGVTKAGESLPQLSLPVTFVPVTFTFEQLDAAVRSLSGAWPSVFGKDANPFVSIASDRRTAELVVTVVEGDLARVQALESKLAEFAPSFPIRFEVGTPQQDAACTSRDNCTSPMKGGARIRKGSTSGTVCTMGFHVQVGTDEQYLTAGHCGYTGSNNWYHQGLGFIGPETATLYPTWEVDARRMQINDSQDSNLLYGFASPVTQSDWPYVGEYVNATLGNSDTVVNALTSSDYMSWTSDTCGCTVYGGRAPLSAIGGDSGSPIVKNGNNYAVGVLSTTGGSFARVQEVLDAWGISLRA